MMKIQNNSFTPNKGFSNILTQKWHKPFSQNIYKGHFQNFTNQRSFSKFSHFVVKNPPKINFSQRFFHPTRFFYPPFKMQPILEKEKFSPVKGYILSDKITGLIGTDKTYQFAQRIQTSEKKKLLISRTDFYVPLATNWSTESKCEQVAFNYMPSCLFENIKQGGVISYYLDQKPVELMLDQYEHPQRENRMNFEDFFAKVKRNLFDRCNTFDPYLFSQDAPVDEGRLGSRVLDMSRAVTSNYGSRFVPLADPKRGKEELDMFRRAFNEAKKDFYSCIKEADKNHSTIVLTSSIDIPKGDIRILIDRNYICVIGGRAPDSRLFQSTESSMIDPERTKVSIDQHGFIQLHIVYR